MSKIGEKLRKFGSDVLDYVEDHKVEIAGQIICLVVGAVVAHKIEDALPARQPSQLELWEYDQQLKHNHAALRNSNILYNHVKRGQHFILATDSDATAIENGEMKREDLNPVGPAFYGPVVIAKVEGTEEPIAVFGRKK